MKTLILPIEIFRREAEGRMLHALVALQAGWDVVLGANLEINRNIWRLPRGVYLFSTLTYKRRLMARMLRRMGFAAQGWDEEGLVYMNRDLYLLRRVSEHTLRHIDHVFAWGEASRQDLMRKAAAAGRQVQAIGNPRLDVLREQFHPLYEEEVRQIRNRYGAFVLFNSNFSSVNFLHKNVDVRKKQIEKENVAQMRKLYERLYNHRQFMFARFREIVPQVARALAPRYRLVVRPHPAEDVQTWHDALRDCPNAEVVSEGPVIPWLLAAGALLHNDCTTAVEARLLGREPVAFVPPDMPQDGVGVLPNGISHHAADVDETMDLLLAALRGELAMTTAQERVLDAYVAGRHGPLAAQRAVRLAGELVDAAPSPSPLAAGGTRLFAMGRHAWKELTPRGRRSRAYIARVFPDDPLDYLGQRLHALGSLLGMETDAIRLRRLGRNIYHLRLAG